MVMLLSVKEVAGRLRVHQVTVRRYVRQGRLSALKVGGRLRIPEDALNALLLPLEGTSKLSKADLRRRKALMKRTLELRRGLPPLGMTTAELLQLARKERDWLYGS